MVHVFVAVRTESCVAVQQLIHPSGVGDTTNRWWAAGFEVSAGASG